MQQLSDTKRIGCSFDPDQHNRYTWTIRQKNDDQKTILEGPPGKVLSEDYVPWRCLKMKRYSGRGGLVSKW